MKKVFCYLGIIILLGLVSFPLILRIVLPEKKIVEENNQSDGNVLLSCSNDVFLTSTIYENKKIKMIVLKKLNNNQDENNSSNLETNDKLTLDSNVTKSKDLNELFKLIKKYNNIVYNVLEDGEVISIDYSVSEHKDLKIESLTQDIENQQLFYENQEMTCFIK